MGPVTERRYISIQIPTKSLAAIFDQNNSETLTSSDELVKNSRKGRKPLCSKEVWLERLCILSLSGKINLNTPVTTIAADLALDLEQQGITKVEPDTIRKDWIKDLIPAAKSLKGSLGK